MPTNVPKYRYILLERFPTDELNLLPETNGKFRVLLPTSDNISLYAYSSISLSIHPLRGNTAVSTSCQRGTEVYTYTPAQKWGAGPRGSSIALFGTLPSVPTAAAQLCPHPWHSEPCLTRLCQHWLFSGFLVGAILRVRC